MKSKSILCLLVLALNFSSFAEDGLPSDPVTADRFTSSYDGSKTISNWQYIGEGVASIFLGMGIGHAIQGRWMEKGWMFTAGGLAVTGGLLFSSYSFVSSIFKLDGNPTKSRELSKYFHLSTGSC